MKTVTMLEFRRRAKMILRDVAAGQEYRVTYRGKPMADLKPPAKPRRSWKDDPFFKLIGAAGSGGGSVTNEEIDEIVYGKCDVS